MLFLRTLSRASRNLLGGDTPASTCYTEDRDRRYSQPVSSYLGDRGNSEATSSYSEHRDRRYSQPVSSYVEDRRAPPVHYEYTSSALSHTTPYIFKTGL